MADTEDRLDLPCGFREQHAEWHDAKICQGIAFIGMKFFGGGNQASRTDNGAQFLNDASVHADLSGLVCCSSTYHRGEREACPIGSARSNSGNAKVNR
jgi:hypothetical protein